MSGERKLRRMTAKDKINAERFLAKNPGYAGKQGISNPESFAYEDVIRHIPVQRTYHQMYTDEYRVNQAVKHAIEDGYLTLDQLTAHTDRMTAMSSAEAAEYANVHLAFKKKSSR